MKKLIRLLEQMSMDIFESGMPAKLDERVVGEMARKLEDAIFKGFEKKPAQIDYDTPDFEMMSSLRTDAWQFSGAKNYQQMRAMTEALEGPDGKLRSFLEFKRAVKPIIGDHAKWLKTEYQTAVASSQMAAKWTRIQRDKDIFPLLEFDAVMDNRTTELCKNLNKVIRPIDDPFWDLYYPPNHFNCRSDVRQLRDGEVTDPEKIEYPDVPEMFRTNLAKTGLLFPKGSAYYVGLPDDVRQQTENIRGKVELERAKKKFEKTPRIIEREELTKPILISNDALKQLYQHARKKNDRLIYDLLSSTDDVLKESKYLGRTIPNQKHTNSVKYSHIFQTTVGDEKIYVIVQEFKITSPLKPYALSKNDEILKNIEEYKNMAW